MEKDFKRAGDLLQDAGSLWNEKNKEYGDNYLHFGKIMSGLFPDGLTLKGNGDFGRFAIFVLIMAKASRYANNFAEGHKDSMDDLTVYSAMLSELDLKGIRD